MELLEAGASACKGSGCAQNAIGVFAGLIVEGLPPSPGRDRHRGIFADRLLGAILGLPAINLSTSFLPSPKAAPGEFASVRGIGTWSANVDYIKL
ncbi:MAG TPA: hypothetical protein V6D31_06470 [Candidatus Sericytochromatia bacterium]